ncbi:glycosyltransferase family 4 protein [Thiohalocapsa marina]|uniref:Glycosyltransferase family 4 protein n=1 Tax=Thiohalocapsa marina TaxID=424902 RepID=A0A5M8FES7_9GAMM|nr:glycosyltransferase family 4 protein [Thiohalocapsa marina]KAA6183169.1 glycosyltransferase family 4 protein [Thiohalocapsa marina]
MSGLRILHVHERAGFYGGVEQILYDTACGLAARGWPQGLLHADPAPQHDYLTPFAWSGRDDRLIADLAPDVLFLHKLEEPAGVAALAAAYPTVRMVHDHDLVCLRRHKYLPLTGRICHHPAGMACYLNGCFVQRAAPGSRVPVRFKGLGGVKAAIRAHRAVRRLMVGSRWMRDELLMNGLDPERVVIVPPIPAALADARPIPPSPSSTQPEILFVGQVIRGKGVDLLLQALAHVPGDWHATIVGTGNHLDTCRALAGKLGLAARVTFAGWVPHQALEPHYAQASLCVVPSRWPEPFGMVGVEAMARGRPVVAFGVGGIPDWLDDGKTGLLAPEADTEALGAAITRLLQDHDYARHLGQAGLERVQTRFRHEQYLDQIMAMLEAAK